MTTSEINRKALLEAWRSGRKAPQPQIPRRSTEDDAPLSFGQQRLWFLETLFPGTALYTMAGGARMRGKVDYACAYRALSGVIDRHQALRSSFAAVDGLPVQKLDRYDAQSLIECVDLRSASAGEKAARPQQTVEELSRTSFALTGPLSKFMIVRLADDDIVLGFAFHHAIADRWSVSVFFRELWSLYGAFSSGQPVPLPSLPIQYADFAAWQRDYFNDSRCAASLAYWHKVLGNSPPLVTLTPDFARPERPTYAGAREPLAIPAEIVAKLRALQTGTAGGANTLFITLMAAFKMLLHRYTGALDITVGTPIANRTRRELEPLIGFFANVLALRSDLSGDPSFQELVERERAAALAAYDHQELPFEYVVERVQPERHLSQSPLFRTVLVLQNSPRTIVQGGDITYERLHAHSGTAKFDLLVSFLDENGTLRGFLEYDTQLYCAESIRAFGERYVRLLTAVASDPNLRVADVDMLSPAELESVVAQASRHVAASANAGECMHRLFEAQVATRPDAIAVSFDDKRMTYRELNVAANQLAHRLRRLGVGAECLVGLHVARGLNVVIGVLGILKAGGAYLPIDPSYPRERIALMLEDSSVLQVVTDGLHAAALPRNVAAIVRIDDESLSQESGSDPQADVLPSNLCYVIYTSGSTGIPKGTLIEHRNVHRLFTSTDAWFDFGEDDVWTLFHSYSFDFSVWELWGALAYGGRLVVIDGAVARAPDRFCQLLADEKVTILNQTPSAFRQLMSAEQARVNRDLALRCIVFGGEALDISALAPWFARYGDRTRLINMYGITETTVHVTYRPIAPHEVTTASGRVIGVPIPDLGVFLLDARGRPVPEGMVGEIHVAGPGLARGYLNRAQLTAERFIFAAFAPSLRLYRTGDLARRSPTGDLEYLGRIDQQVKVRGYRVELGEIVAALDRLDEVKESAVLAREDAPGDQRIVAYVVPNLPQETTDEVVGAVSAWQTVFDRTYELEREELPADFNIVGWTSAYDGENIPDVQMREWVEETVRTLLDLRPRRVLEVGCGTGLLLSRVAPHCKEYVATDFSAVALDSVRRNLLEHRPELAHVRLAQASALDLRAVGDTKFDLIIINSVAQYFPSVDYLANVLDACVSALDEQGVLFVGDVRNRDLHGAFHASVELHENTHASADAWARSARARADRDSELIVDPAFFLAYRQHNARITQVQVRHKRGQFANELTLFRYDALLAVDGEAVPVETTLAWPDPQANPLALPALLERDMPNSLLVEGVPNARLDGVAEIVRALGGEGGPVRPQDLRAKMLSAQVGDDSVDPEAYWALSERLPYRVQVFCRAGDPLRYDVALHHVPPWEAHTQAPSHCMTLPSSKATVTLDGHWTRFANRPLMIRLRDQLVANIDEKLSASLPHFMVPSAYVLLDGLPLNENGKLDRRMLPTPAANVADTKGEPPRNNHERRVARLFARVLGLRRVGRSQDFFDLGGHSLLAAQLMFQVRQEFGNEISLQSLFMAPTVAGIAALLDERAPAKPVVVDLPAEVHCHESIRVETRACAAAAGSAVLLTGATGFVGAYLLRSLLDATDGPVRCLVRAADADAARRRLLEAFAAHRIDDADFDRVTPIAGDLARPLFGLGASAFEALADGLDAIYHNGATINFTFPYAALKAANVDGTHEVLRLAARADARLHYVSTLYVFGRGDGAAGAITEATVPADWADLRMGYTQSKWVSERMIDEARVRGLRASIYRLGRISGSSVTGCGPHQDMFWQVVRLGLILGVMPDLDGPLDLTPADFVANAIVGLARSPQREHVFHLHNTRPTNGRRVLDVLVRRGWRFEVEPFVRWRQMLSERASTLAADDTSFGVASLLGGDSLASPLTFSSARSAADVATCGMTCPLVEDELIGRYLDYFTEIGFLSTPIAEPNLAPTQ